MNPRWNNGINDEIKVVSWPPCGDPDEVNTPATLPINAPFIQSWPKESIKAFI